MPSGSQRQSAPPLPWPCGPPRRSEHFSPAGQGLFFQLLGAYSEGGEVSENRHQENSQEQGDQTRHEEHETTDDQNGRRPVRQVNGKVRKRVHGIVAFELLVHAQRPHGGGPWAFEVGHVAAAGLQGYLRWPGFSDHLWKQRRVPLPGSSSSDSWFVLRMCCCPGTSRREKLTRHAAINPPVGMVSTAK